MSTADHDDYGRDLGAARNQRDSAAAAGGQALQRFLDDVLAGEARASRNRGRWLHQRATEEARFSGVLRDLCEQRAAVVVTTVVGNVHRGSITAVGRDFVVVQAGTSRSQLLAIRAISTVRTAPGARRGAVTGRRDHAHDVTLQEVLSGIAPARAEVVAFTASESNGVAGRLVAAGEDVVTIQLHAADQGQIAYVHMPAHALAEIAVAA